MCLPSDALSQHLLGFLLPWTWGISSRLLQQSAATTPWTWGCSSRPPPLTSGKWWLLSIIKKAGEFQKNIYFCFIDYAKAFDCVDHNKLWKIVKEMGIPEHLTYLLRNLYAGQEATVRTRHGTTDWFQIGKGIR